MHKSQTERTLILPFLVAKNQEIKIKTEEIVLISSNLTEISTNLYVYFLKIAEISIKLHKEPTYFLGFLDSHGDSVPMTTPW